MRGAGFASAITSPFDWQPRMRRLVRGQQPIRPQVDGIQFNIMTWNKNMKGQIEIEESLRNARRLSRI